MRAVSEADVSAAGGLIVTITTEEDYFRWMFTNHPPKTEDYSLGLLSRVE